MGFKPLADGFWIDEFELLTGFGCDRINVIPVDIGRNAFFFHAFHLGNLVHGFGNIAFILDFCFNQFDNLVIQVFCSWSDEGHHILVRNFWTAKEFLGCHCIGQGFEAHLLNLGIGFLDWLEFDTV
ncbi:Uncharacterised protein [Streptococcus pneumoniae]|nr:Uncharacterised protein [Streptococcus pneumoniae]